MSTSEPAASPRLQILRQALEREPSSALLAFWDEISEQGTPLVEPLLGDETHSLVTFLWRDDESSAVTVLCLLGGSQDRNMTRLRHSDLWFKTYRVRNDVRLTYQFVPEGPAQIGQEEEKTGNPWDSWRNDPLDPLTFAFVEDPEEDPSDFPLIRSVLQMPEAPPQPWIQPRADAPSGQVSLQRVQSDVLGNERRVWVYTPPGYAPHSDVAYGLLILFDGWPAMKSLHTPTILDNLLASGRLPPLVALFVDSLDGETRMRELLYHKPLNDFLVKELVPWARSAYRVTTDPRQTIVGGVSAGGLAAAFAALHHPGTFGCVLSQSGAFRHNPEGEEEPFWLARQFAAREKLDLSFHLDAGLLEVHSLWDAGSGPSLLEANRHLRDVLSAKGYRVHYTEFAGGHDYISWRGTLAGGLQALLGSA